MKQFQFAYINEIKLKNDIEKVRAVCAELPYSKVYFQIYSEIMDTTDVELICDVLDEEMPDALYAGCSTNGNILDGEWTLAQIILIATIFEDPSTQIEIQAFDMKRLNTAAMFNEVINKNRGKQWVKAVQLNITFEGRHEDFFRNIIDNMNTPFIVYGGGAYNAAMDGEKSYVFAKGSGFIESGFTTIFLGGTNFFVKAGSVMGWKPLGRSFNITRAEDNMLYELDNEPAYLAYSKYLNIKNDEYFSTNSIEFPLLCQSASGLEILRTPVSCNADGSICMFSHIDNYESVRLTYGDPNTILDNVHLSTEEIRQFAPDVIQTYSCVARKAFWDRTVSRETLPYQQIAPTSGFYTSGELMTEDSIIHLYNETLVVVAWREGTPQQFSERPAINTSIENGRISLNSRLVNFITVATHELEEANHNLDDLLSEVEAKREEADAANQAKSDFLANMSHEIRTPINAILGFDTMILRETKDESLTKYAMDIQSSGENLLSIINDILDLSKVESGRMEIVPVEYDFSSVLNDIINMTTVRADKKGLKVLLDIDEKIPTWLYGDDVRLRQVIINLMNNAVKYTETGHVKLTIHGDSIGVYEVLHVSISDTGIGIKEEDMAGLFEKFRRVESKRNHYVEGTGLGITITASLLNLMDSSLKVESEVGKGSNFFFDVRQGIVRNEPLGDFKARLEAHKVQYSYSALFTAPDAKILLVDDNEINRSVIVNLLKETQVQIEEAAGGYEFLDKTADTKYDLVLLDHMMPDLDGVTAYHTMKATPTNKNLDTPVIILTANAITGAKEDYLEEGFTSYLSKPVNPEKLEATLRDYLPTDKIITSSYSDAETDATAAPQKNTSTLLPEIEGLDMDYALLKLRKPDIVINAIQMFMGAYTAEASKLSEFFEIIKAHESGPELDAALADYRIKVHAMKSNAATIGSNNVSGLARFLEYAARDGKRTEIITITPTFLSDWKELGDRIRDYYTSEADGDALPLDAAYFRQKLPELSAHLAEMDIDAADAILSELKTYDLPPEISEKMELLSGAVLNIDLDEVEKIVNCICDML